MSISSTEYQNIKATSVQGRYVIFDQIESFLKRVGKHGIVETVGESVLGMPIQSIRLGKGSKKILMWSQMHGNESTTTKAVLDVIRYLGTASSDAKQILDKCTILILPMLNPDGAAAYTRVNANEVDLNRDAQQRTQPESVVLRKVFDAFRPDYCFNLHDQRTIYNVGDTPAPATVSFLAPAHDEERNISPSRAESMQLILAMNKVLQKHIPGQVGRYDDAFNVNCVGDTFQMTGTPTVLFEAGHYHDDYQREYTREYIFYAITTALQAVGTNTVDTFDESQYFSIPENNKLFLDVVIRNAQTINASLKSEDAIGILYVEKLKNRNIVFEPKIEISGDLKSYYGHKTYNGLIDSDLKALKSDAILRELFPVF